MVGTRKLDPTHNMRIMGTPCCAFCPGNGDHTGQCAENNEKENAPITYLLPCKYSSRSSK